MATKERYQNPATNDTINLRTFVYNSNELASVETVVRVDIYQLDENAITPENTDGRRLVDTFDGNLVEEVATGTYLLAIEATSDKYVIGKYVDVWTIIPSDGRPETQISNLFQIYPSLWYSTPIPIVYDFSFHFQPNKFRQGSIQYLIIEIRPNVPTAGDLRKYYENLAIVADLKITIEQNCGDCMPAESDLRTVVDNQLVDYREKRYGYYHLDTTEMSCGIYDVTFRLEFGGNVYISDRMHIQIYD